MENNVNNLKRRQEEIQITIKNEDDRFTLFSTNCAF